MRILITLIKKDFILLQRSLTPALVFPIFMALIAAYVNEQFFMLLLTMILSAYLPSFIIQVLTLDENTRWDKYVLSLPVKPEIEACARYVLLLILSLCSVLLIFVIGSAARMTGFVPITGNVMRIACLYGLIYGLLMGDIAIPIMYRFGAVNGRYVIMIFTIIPILIGVYVATSKIPAFFFKFSITELKVFFSAFIVLITVTSFLSTWNTLKRRNLKG